MRKQVIDKQQQEANRLENKKQLNQQAPTETADEYFERTGKDLSEAGEAFGKASKKTTEHASGLNLFYLTNELSNEDIEEFRKIIRLPQLKTLTGSSKKNLHFSIIDGRVAVNQTEVDALSAQDHGLGMRLTNTFFALEQIVRSGGELNSTNVGEAIRKAIDTQNKTASVTELTPEGKQIDNQTVQIPELQNNAIFESSVTIATCADDANFVPSEQMLFQPKGLSLFHLLKNKGRSCLQEIENKVGKVAILIEEKKPQKIILQGSPAKIAEARNHLIRFTQLIAKHEYKKEEDLETALLCVFGAMKEEHLPSPSKPSASKGMTLATSGAALAGMPVNLLTPRTTNQETYVDLLNSDRSAVLTQGPAGTGKTVLFLQYAMLELQKYYRGEEGAKFSKLILSIPLVNVGGKDLGAMPGTLEKKTEMWFDTYYMHLTRILASMGTNNKPDLERGDKNLKTLIAAGIIQIAPLEFLRGKSFEGALIGLDEAQNATAEQMTTFLTRAEETSRLFVFGDLEQRDRTILKTLQGEAYRVPSTVQIDDKGIVAVNSHGRWVELGFHKDLGDFVMNSDGNNLEKVHPRNGFAMAALLFNASPHIACTALNFSDIQRSGVGRDLLVLARGLRVLTDGTSMLPRGHGSVNATHILDEADVKSTIAASHDSVVELITKYAPRRNNTKYTPGG